MKKFGLAAAALALMFTSACGGGRPSEGELSDAIQSGADELGSLASGAGEITKDAADCMAKVLHDSDVSDEALKAIADKDEDFEPKKSDEDALKDSAKDFVKCIPGMEDLQKQLEDATKQ